MLLHPQRTPQRIHWHSLPATARLSIQATVGDVNIERPGMFSMEGRAKWDAWNDVKGLAKEDAMKQYTAEIKRQQAEYA